MVSNEQDLFDLSANELLALSLLLSILLSDGLNSNQLNILGNFCESIGQNILLIQSLVGAEPDPNAIYCLNKPGQFLPNFAVPISSNQTQELDKLISEIEIRLQKIEIFLSNESQH